MFKLTYLLALLPALALASPVTPTRLQKRDSHRGLAFVGDTLNNLCKAEVDGAIYVVGLYSSLFGEGDACGAMWVMIAARRDRVLTEQRQHHEQREPDHDGGHSGDHLLRMRRK